MLPAAPSATCIMILEREWDGHHDRRDMACFACRIELMPDLSCYPELHTLELQHNNIAGIAAQTGVCMLAALNMSDNRLQSLSTLHSLHLLARLAWLEMSGNSLELDTRQAPHPPYWQQGWSLAQDRYMRRGHLRHGSDSHNPSCCQSSICC